MRNDSSCAAWLRAAASASTSREGTSQAERPSSINSGTPSTREATIEQHRALEALAEAQVARLDGAFDADVKARGALSAEWVIAHRKAYVTARDAMVDQKQSLRVGQATLEGNLQSIDLALGQLQRLHTIEQRVRLPEVLK